MADTPDRLKELLARLRQFVHDRDWEQFHDAKNLAMCLASEAGELLAEYRWVPNTEADAHSRETEARTRIAAEIGDVGIALLLLSNRIEIDLIQAMQTKLEQNAKKYPADKARGHAEVP